MRACSVYRLYAADDRLLYIGMTGDFDLRLSQHLHPLAHEWSREIHHWTVADYDTRDAAFEVEQNAIYGERPEHNKFCHRPGGFYPRTAAPGLTDAQYESTKAAWEAERDAALIPRGTWCGSRDGASLDPEAVAS